MIHYFNPGHEAAVLTDSPFYQAPAAVKKMQEDLASLPYWYAAPGDFVWISQACNDPAFQFLHNQEVDFWGISRQAIHLFENYSKQYNLSLRLPEWNPRYKELSDREFAADCLSCLIKEITEIQKNIIPLFFSDLSEIENYNRLSPDKLLAKSPYSSSGRGLLWLEKSELSRSSRQIIQGVLNRQKKISLEKTLEKIIDFSMHFLSDEFIGYSIFQTNAKGAYEKTWLASQEKIITKLTTYVEPDLLERVKQFFLEFIREKIRPYYQGNIGIDMMIYQSEEKHCLHPCVEINLRKSMGYLSLQLFQNYLSSDAEAFFSVEYNSIRKAETIQTNNFSRIRHGIFDLCPVNPDTKYRAILEVPPLS